MNICSWQEKNLIYIIGNDKIVHRIALHLNKKETIMEMKKGLSLVDERADLWIQGINVSTVIILGEQENDDDNMHTKKSMKKKKYQFFFIEIITTLCEIKKIIYSKMN